MPDLFISYAREDQGFVRRLHDALSRRGKQAWVDWDDIPPTAQWRDEIRAGVSGADAFVFVLSPDSLESSECGEELGVAVAQNKRIVPLLWREPDGASVPHQLAAANWIFFKDAEFDRALETLVAALDTDLERVRLHTRLLVRAGEWEDRGRDASRLLRGADLREAEAFMAALAPEPQPTALQREYVAASRRAAGRRQRALLTGVSIALAVAIGLGIVALIERSSALERQRIALSRALTADALAELRTDPELAVLLASEAVRRHATPEADLALREAVGADQLRASLPHAGAVRAVQFSPDGNTVGTASSDRTARLWSAGTGRLLHVLRGHRSPLTGLSFGGPGGTLLTAGQDRTVREWQASTGSPVGPPLNIPGPATQAQLTPDGRTIVAATGDGALRLWDARTHRLEATLGSPAGGPVTRFALSRDGSLVAAGDSRTGVLRLWNVRTHAARVLRSRRAALGDATRAEMRLHHHRVGGRPKAPAVLAVAFSPNGRLLAAGDAAGTTLVYRVRGGLVGRLYGAPGVAGPGFDSYDEVKDVSFSPDGRSVVAAGSQGVARVWAVFGGRLEASLRAGSPVETARFSPDGMLVATGSADGLARVWTVAGARPVATLAGHTGIVRSVSFGLGGRAIATAAGGDPVARLWRSYPGRLLGEIDNPGLTAFNSTSNSSDILSTGQDGVAEVDNVVTGARVTRRSFGGPVANEQISPDGRYSALDTTRAVREVDASTLGRGRDVAMQAPAAAAGAGRAPAPSRAAAPSRAGAVAYSGSLGISAGGARVASGTVGGSAYVWDGASGRLLSTLAPPPGTSGQPTVSAALSVDGRRVLIVGQTAASYTAAIYDAASGRRLSVVPLPGGQTPVANALLSPDGSKIATSGLSSGSSPAPGLFDVASGRRLLTFPSKASGIAAASFSHDGRLLVTGGEDGAVTVWTLATGERQLVASLPDFSINDAEVSVDDRLVGVAGNDGVARVFDVASGTSVGVLAGGQVPVSQMQFTSVLGPITTLDRSYRLRFYACDVCGTTADVLRAAGRLVTRRLTPAERRQFLAGS